MERTIYELQCPCGYYYWLSVPKEPEWEICPVCGLGMEFRLFLKEANDVRDAYCVSYQQNTTSRVMP